MIKEFIKNWLFKEEQLNIKIQGERIAQSFTDYVKSEKETKDKFLNSFSIRHYLAAELSVFNPELLKNKQVTINQQTGEPIVLTDIVAAAKLAGIGEMELYANGSSIFKNQIFKFMIEYLQSNQMLLSFYTASSDKALDFGRAHVVASQEIYDQFQILNKINEEKNKPQEKFDPHDVM